MNNRENVPFVEEKEKSTLFSKNCHINKILEICINSKTKNEFENILINFWKKYEQCVSERVDFHEFDVVCMYTLNYVYEDDTVSLSAVLRSLYAYHQYIQIASSEEDRNSWISCNQDSFLEDLRQITNVNTYSKCEEMLVDIVLFSILDGNVGLTRFLIKYGLVHFPIELNEKCKRMTKLLIDGFNDSFEHSVQFRPTLNTRTNIQFDELLNVMSRSKINFRRFFLTFCAIILVSEYSTYNVEEMDSRSNTINESMRTLNEFKFTCLNLFIDDTTETYITFKDIENFIAIFIDPLLHADLGRYLLQCFRERFGEYLDNYNPRSLKDLTRCRVRANLRNSMMFPEQVNQLLLPRPLKNFLLFHDEKTWNLLKFSHFKYNLDRSLKSHASLIRASIMVVRVTLLTVRESLLAALNS